MRRGSDFKAHTKETLDNQLKFREHPIVLSDTVRLASNSFECSKSFDSKLLRARTARVSEQFEQTVEQTSMPDPVSSTGLLIAHNQFSGFHFINQMFR